MALLSQTRPFPSKGLDFWIFINVYIPNRYLHGMKTCCPRWSVSPLNKEMALLPPSSSIPQPWAGLLNLNKRLHTLCLPTEIEEMLPWMICISSKRRNGFSFPISPLYGMSWYCSIGWDTSFGSISLREHNSKYDLYKEEECEASTRYYWAVTTTKSC